MSALTSAQIIQQACLIAHCPSFGVIPSGATDSPAGRAYNAILENLALDADLDLARGTFFFTMNPGLVSTDTQLQSGSGPYPLPLDFLRFEKGNNVYFINGVPYPMVPIELEQFDQQVQTNNNQGLPYWFVTDVSLTPKALYLYPPPNAAHPARTRYRRQMPVIANPETSDVSPWFPDSLYLYNRLAYEMMKVTDDERARAFHDENKELLSKYISLADDRSDRAQKVQLDRRTFGRRFSSLRNTKNAGW